MSFLRLSEICKYATPSLIPLSLVANSGKHTSATDFTEAKKLHHRFWRHETLGSGTYGVVEKVAYTHTPNSLPVYLARKRIPYCRGRTIQMLREEAYVMEKLDHEHIVKLVGTYCIRLNELYLLLWPVAVCNLDDLFNDLDSLRTGEGDQDEVVRRLEALGVADVRALERDSHRQGPGQSKTRTATGGRGDCPLQYLQRVTGCISRAVAYCHAANIRHLDLKPSNILLSPGRVYLADFGIARDVNDRDRTMTMGLQGTPKWRAPEVCEPDDEWSMKAADVYSLGLVLLNIATVLYGARMADFDRVVDELDPGSRAQMLSQFYPALEAAALATQDFRDAKAHTFAPRHIADLAARMLSSKPSQRPNAGQVDAELAELGGIDQVYHAPCCKRGSRFVADRMDARLRAVADERDRLAADCQRLARRVEVLEGKDETYEERLKNERRSHAQDVARLQEQLDKERRERSRLEGMHPPKPRQKPPAGIPQPPHGVSWGGRNDANRPGPVAHNRTRPGPRPLPAAAAPPPASFPSASAPVPKAAQLTPLSVWATTRALYSQAAAAGGSGRQPPSAAAPRSAEDDKHGGGGPAGATPRRDTLSAAAAAADTGIPSPSPSPKLPNGTAAAGFPLRSRGSGSRLPRLVTPTTPIRSATPALLSRDPSATDSTQCSLASSTFSRLSLLTRESESELGSPAVPGAAAAAVTTTPSKVKLPARADADDNTKGPPAAARPDDTDDAEKTRGRSRSPGGGDDVGGVVGSGLVRLDHHHHHRREMLSLPVDDEPQPPTEDTERTARGGGRSTTPDRAGFSVVGSAASPVLAASALSSPRSAKAEFHPLATAAGASQVPPLPTAKSWADVARRERRV